MIALANGITELNGRNGYIEKFISRNTIHRTVRLHGHGASVLPSNYEERTIEVRTIRNPYPLHNIYNMDESGSFYRLCPRMSYLSSKESRASAHVTGLQHHKNRISIVLCVNSDGSHTVSV